MYMGFVPEINLFVFIYLQCARDGNPDNMRRLLEVTSNVKKKVNQHDDEGLSALHYAARYNHYPIVVMLISAGASESDNINNVFSSQVGRIPVCHNCHYLSTCIHT